MLKVKVNGNKEFEVQAHSATEGSINGNTYELDLRTVKPGTFHALRNGKSFTIDVVRHDAQAKTMLLLVNGNRYSLELRDQYDELLRSLGMNASARVVKELKAPMPGMVLQTMVAPGDAVGKDQPLIVLEAMKMENVLKAPAEAVIKSINVNKGNAVEKNQVLITFE